MCAPWRKQKIDANTFAITKIFAKTFAQTKNIAKQNSRILAKRNFVNFRLIFAFRENEKFVFISALFTRAGALSQCGSDSNVSGSELDAPHR
jgi:hypothetical protein